MTARNSNQDADGTVWTPVGLRLGTEGMDLRRPSEPPALADLVNARFLDERTVRRRNGFNGIELRDGDLFPAGTVLTIGGIPVLVGGLPLFKLDPAEWVYGHGQVVNANQHYPIHKHGQATFSLGGEAVAWTGDRLLVPQDGGAPALGASSFWQRLPDIAAGDASTKLYPRGIPAHLPLVDDEPAPGTIYGDWVETCLTSKYRVFVTVKSNKVTATVLDRASGSVISVTDLTGTSAAPVEPTAVSSGDVAVVLWRDTTDGLLRFRALPTEDWTPEDHYATAVDAYDIAIVSDGFHVLWSDSTSLKVGRVIGYTGQSGPYLFGTTLATSGSVSGRAIALAVAPNGHLGVVHQDGTDARFDEFNADATTASFGKVVRSSWTPQGVTAAARGLTYTSGVNEWVIHTGDDVGDVQVTSVSADYPATTQVYHKYNSDLVSKSFVIGDEVFAHLRSRNSDTVYLLCGATHPYVSGFSDRETGKTPKVPSGDPWVYWPQRVLSGDVYSKRTWCRQYDTGDAARPGDVATGDLDFLPALSVAVYGRSAYLSGSCVKNWDGRSLSDAGFQDYPKVSLMVQGTGGSLTVGGTYEWEVRAVRYNDLGERFESTILRTPSTLMTASNNKMTLTIQPPPGVSTDDYNLEVYRTETLGVGMFLEGTISGPFTSSATTTFVSTMADSTLIKQKGDPHVADSGSLSILEPFGPLGCAFLTTIGDRLWGAGGQVGKGIVQYSTLKSVGFGASFDDLAGYIQVDNEDGAITSIAGLNNAVAIFEASRIFVIAGGGPDNFGVGDFQVPELVLSAGAVSHFGTVLTQMGVLYWGAGGPLLLTQGLQVVNVSSQVRPLTETLTPAGAQVDTARMEVVWYCGNEAILMNYMTGAPRWSRWTLPTVVGCSDAHVITPVGRFLTEDATGPGDDGTPYAFAFHSGNLRANDLLEGYSLMGRVGVLGAYNGNHQLRIRASFDGSPLHSEEHVWSPPVDTWLTSVESVQGLTPAQVDALVNTDRSGQYATHKRLKRQTCHYASFEVSDISSWTPTYTPFELSLLLGAKPGLGRTAVNTFTSTGGGD